MRQQDRTVRRSETHSFALPNINRSTGRYSKIHSSRAQMARPSSFVARLKQVTPDMEYQYAENEKINDEQSKLKKLLRQFNQDTFEILSSRVHRMNQTSDKQQKISADAIIAVRSREIQNNNSIVSLCQKEIAILEQKCQNLKYLSVDEFQKRIAEMEKQIEHQKVENKQIIRENTLTGLRMAKESKQIINLRQLQYDKFALQNKRAKLEQQKELIEKQIAVIQQRDAKASSELEKIEVQYKQALGEQQQRVSNIKKIENIADKEKIKKQNLLKKSALDSKNQQFYLKVLRQMDQCAKRRKLTDDQISGAENAIEQIKKKLQEFQGKVASRKINGVQKSIVLKDQK